MTKIDDIGALAPSHSMTAAGQSASKFSICRRLLDILSRSSPDRIEFRKEHEVYQLFAVARYLA